MRKEIKFLSTAIVAASLLIVTACGGSEGSDSSDTTVPAEIKYGEVEVSVSCGPWRETASFGVKEADCDVNIRNTSAASGSVQIAWDWKDGDQICGMGGLDSWYNVDGYESGTVSSVQKRMACPVTANPKATNIKVRISS